MSEEGSTKRRLPRYHTDVGVTLYQPTGSIHARITQISRRGCLIFPPLPPQPTSALKMTFRLADEMPYINCKGEIAYSIHDKGTGVIFTEISIHNQDLITDYFEKRLAAGSSVGA